MKYFTILVCLVPLAFSASIDLDPEDELDEDAFEEYFHLELVTDPEEHEKREEALKENEALIKENNEKFMNGERTWWDEVNEFADLPEDEFEKEKTGDTSSTTEYGRGLLRPTEEEMVDERSERYFDQFRYSRASVPSSYSSVDLGLVSPVKNQKQCGSCVAFSNMAAVETCFKKVTGVFGDYSEQQFVDCGYKKNGANGCNGAPTHAYIKWAADTKADLTHESLYPYLNKNPKLTCPANLDGYNQGAKVTESYYTYKGDEETLKKLVYKHGAVVTAVKAAGPFQDYAGGIFAGCTSSEPDHAVTVVGYGTEGGQDFWLIKNSWSSGWGEKGYIRLKRGVGMCGVGKDIVTVDCAKTAGPTDAPITTEAPCDDKWTNCPDLAKENCWRSSVSTNCPKSCGKCKGMTPVASNTCYDTYGNCPDLAKTNCKSWGSKCKKSCGLCEGMTPHSSNTCYNLYSNCADVCSWFDGIECGLACNTC